MNKQHDSQMFEATTRNGNTYSFECYTTYTRNGFCHHAYNYESGEMTRVSYLNRTWERFEYESVLRSAIEKCPKADREDLNTVLIEKKALDEEKRCNILFDNFKSAYDKLSDKRKEAMKGVEINSVEDAKSVTLMMNMLNAIDKI